MDSPQVHRKQDGFLAPAPQQTASARVWAVQHGGQINSFHSDSAAAMAALNAVGEEGHGVPSVNSRYVMFVFHAALDGTHLVSEISWTSSLSSSFCWFALLCPPTAPGPSLVASWALL